MLLSHITMSFLNQIFSNKTEEIHKDWKEFHSLVQLDEILEISQERPVIIFKHSVRCGISAMAKYQLEADWKFSQAEVEMYYLDIIHHRNISNEVRDRLGVVHHSPQIILISRGKAVYDTSHHMISSEVISEAISTLAA